MCAAHRRRSQRARRARAVGALHAATALTRLSLSRGYAGTQLLRSPSHFYPFDRHRHPQPAADAQRRQAASSIPFLHLVQQRDEDARAGRTNRMSERDGAAVHVQLLERNGQVAENGQHLGRERLVQLHQIEVVQRQLEAGQEFPDRRHRSDAHDAWVHACGCPAEDSRTCRDIGCACPASRHQDHGRGAVGDPRRRAGGDDAGLSLDLAEHQRQLSQAVDRGLRPRMLVSGDDGRRALRIGDRDRSDLFIETSGGDVRLQCGVASRARRRRTPHA